MLERLKRLQVMLECARTMLNEIVEQIAPDQQRAIRRDLQPENWIVRKWSFLR